MKSTMRFGSGWMFFAITAVFACWFSAFPLLANAQGNPGNDAVYPTSGICCKGSSAFIDASMFATNPPPPSRNFCGVLNFVLQNVDQPPNYPSGAVIDARGLPGTTGTSMTCTVTNPSPWAGITNPPPSVILLPAGTIVIPSAWVLPNNTRLIGEGDALNHNFPSGTIAAGTTLQACKSSCTFTGTDMIDLGSSTLCPLTNGCNNVSVEHLALDGLGQFLNGIVNSNAQTGTYVDHVSLFQILGTGLWLEGNASHSGPYSNLTFDTGGFSGTLQTVCANINGLSGTRGIHGLSCDSESSDANAAVLLDSSNNSIEDVRIVGFYDGIRIGANATAQSNVLFNIIGDTNLTGTPSAIIIVHITSMGHTVSDLSIMGANNAGGSPQTITIQDDVTGPKLTDTSVAMYVLGQQESSTQGYSRFTTSPNWATWAAGPNAPGNTACARGSLYSCTGSSNGCSGFALWACALNGSNLQWVAVK
jgi:hypothetical protein